MILPAPRRPQSVALHDEVGRAWLTALYADAWRQPPSRAAVSEAITSKRGVALTLTGLFIGLVLAAIAARSVTSLLYGFRPDYLPTVNAVSLILLAVAALACYVPARRASRVDPVIALRNE
jgi:hypothetical protein